MNKKGQITVVIIIGILMLLLVGSFLFISSKITRQKVLKEAAPAVSTVPDEFVPIKAFVENCMRVSAEKGLLLLGQQGGYIDPGAVAAFDSADHTENDGLLLDPLRVPYWWYNKEANAGNKIAYTSLRPPLRKEGEKGAFAGLSIESQLAAAVDRQLPSCTKGFLAFKAQGFIVKEKQSKTKITVTPAGVVVTTEYPLTIEKGEESASPTTFSVQIPVKLQKLYDVASLITQTEQDFTFLENHALDLLSVYGAVDTKKLPPMTATTFELAPTASWTTTDVKQKITGLLTSYTPLLRFLGSSNFVRAELPATTELSPLHQKIYDNMIIPLAGAEDLEVSFSYWAWEPYLDVNSKDDVIQSQDILVTPPEGFPIPFVFGMQRYSTAYDLSWPVLITLRDPDAFNGQGYDFVFALEANIRNNRPAKPEQVLPPAVSAFSTSMVCDKNKRDAGPLLLNVIDAATKKPLEKVQIGFSVPNQDTCILGTTDNEGAFKDNFPAVYGGVLNLVKQDYLISFYPVDTYKYKDEQYKGKQALIGYASGTAAGAETGGTGNVVVSKEAQPFELYPIATVNARIEKKNLEKCIDDTCYFAGALFTETKPVHSYEPALTGDDHKWVFVNTPQKLKATEQAIVTLTRVGDVRPNSHQSSFVTSAAATGNEAVEIQLVPGVYEVSGFLTRNEELVIPEDERCADIEVLGIEVDEECTTLPETRMPQFPAGRIEWDDKKTYLTLTPEKLYGANTITFYILNQDEDALPVKSGVRVHEDLQLLGEMGAISKKEEVRKALEPRFT